jgi:uncharacterized protein (TIGR04255 family)
LDLDAYSAGAFDLGDVNAVINNAHAIIQEAFETSITDKTRKLMKQKK